MKMSIEEWLEKVSKQKGNYCNTIGCSQCPFNNTECDRNFDFKKESNRLYKKYTKLKLIKEILK